MGSTVMGMIRYLILILCLLSVNEASREINQTCLLCELIVQVVDYQLETEASVDQIQSALFSLCDLLQPGMEEDCKATIFQLDLQTIVDIIVELGLRPKAVCEYLGFCPSLEFEKVN